MSEIRRGVRLGVDVGSVRVGLAACDPYGLLATPVDTLKRDTRAYSDIERIADEVREREALEVIVGNPVHLNGRVGQSATGARDYAEALARHVAPVTVRLVDERLSTVSAQRQLRSAGVGGRGQRQVVDQAAAVIVLQNALDAERSTGRAPGEIVSPAGRPDGPLPG